MKNLIFGALAAAVLPATALAQDGGLKSTGDLISWLLSTLGVVAFIFILALLIKKTRVRFGQSGHLTVVSSLSVGPKERVVEIKACGRTLLLGVGPGNVRLLCDLSTGEDFKNAVTDELALNKIRSGKMTDGSDDEHRTSEISDTQNDNAGRKKI